jgi:hypothetical protein
MISAATLADAFKRNATLVKTECEGLSHADSLLQPQPRGNCLNWVVGHMLTGRNSLLAALNAPFRVADERLDPYQRESAPITAEGDGVVPLAQLLEWLTEGQTHLSERIAALTDADIEKEFMLGTRLIPLSDFAFFLYFHDTYHVGQTSYLRQLAGKNDHTL